MTKYKNAIQIMNEQIDKIIILIKNFEKENKIYTKQIENNNIRLKYVNNAHKNLTTEAEKIKIKPEILLYYDNPKEIIEEEINKIWVEKETLEENNEDRREKIHCNNLEIEVLNNILTELKQYKKILNQ